MEKTLHYEGTETEVVIRDAAEHLQKYWVSGNFYEAQRNGMLTVVYQREKKGGKFIDIGASIGNHTLFFIKVMQGEVIAFEPQRESFTHLEENLRLNDLKATTHCVALGDHQGFVEMINPTTNNVGMYQVDEDGDIKDTYLDILDNYIDEVEGYDVIKIDVEQYNRQLLTGACKVLTNGRGNVYIEADTPEVLTETDSIMAGYNYHRVPDLKMNATPTYLYIKNQPYIHKSLSDNFIKV